MRNLGSLVMEMRGAANCTRAAFAPLAGLTRTELENFEVGLLNLPPEKAEAVAILAEELELATALHPTIEKISNVDTARDALRWLNAFLDRELAEWRKVRTTLQRRDGAQPSAMEELKEALATQNKPISSLAELAERLTKSS